MLSNGWMNLKAVCAKLLQGDSSREAAFSKMFGELRDMVSHVIMVYFPHTSDTIICKSGPHPMGSLYEDL